MERLTQSAFYTTARALFERDRALFSLLCAIEVTRSSQIMLSVWLRYFVVAPQILRERRASEGSGTRNELISRARPLAARAVVPMRACEQATDSSMHDATNVICFALRRSKPFSLVLEG